VARALEDDRHYTQKSRHQRTRCELHKQRRDEHQRHAPCVEALVASVRQTITVLGDTSTRVDEGDELPVGRP